MSGVYNSVTVPIWTNCNFPVVQQRYAFPSAMAWRTHFHHFHDEETFVDSSFGGPLVF